MTVATRLVQLTIAALEARLGRSPSITEIATDSGLSTRSVKRHRVAMRQHPPLHRGSDRNGQPLLSLPSCKPPPPVSSRPRQVRGWRQRPEGEVLTPARVSLATGCGLPASQVGLEWAKFGDHDFARPRLDVDRTWRNWCRTAAADLRGKAPARLEARALAPRKRDIAWRRQLGLPSVG